VFIAEATRHEGRGLTVEFVGMGVRGRFLMLVKTYPSPSASHDEVVCCAGLDASTKEWVRLYPINFRNLDDLAKFKKWQFIDAVWRLPRRDGRSESRRVEEGSIKAGDFLPPGRGWTDRRVWLDAVVDESLEELKALKGRDRRTLGVIRPARVRRLIIRPAKTHAQRATLGLEAGSGRRRAVQPIPFDFVYEFECRGGRCKGHKMEIFDWEAGAAYRKFLASYGPTGWETAFRQTWEADLPGRDLHLVLGTHSTHPNTWMIVGVLAPPIKVSEGDRRSRRQRIGEEGAMTLPGFGLEAEQGDGLGADVRERGGQVA
jgi:hypothetical protein